MSAKSNARGALIVGGFPKISLLPPETRSAGRLRSVKTTLALLLILVLGGVGGAVYWAMTEAQAAQDRLDAENARSTELLQAQTEFGELTTTRVLVDTLEEAQRVVTVMEVDWLRLYRSLSSVIPRGGELVSFGVSSNSPMSPFAMAQSPVAVEAMGSVSFTVETPSLIESALFVQALDTIPGYAWSQVDTVADDGSVRISGVVYFTTELLMERFAVPEDGAEGEAAEEGSAGGGTETDDPAESEPSTEQED